MNKRQRSGMPAVDLSHAVWRKSSRSTANGDCVEVASVDGVVAVRDSKDPAGPALVFWPGEWDAFVNGVRDRQFDRP